MNFNECSLKGAFVITSKPFEDDRGYFTEIWNKEEFLKHGIKSEYNRTALSFNTKSLTLRGMHFQKPPHTEAKIVRVTRGRIYDVIVDLRPESSTFQKWEAVELSDDNFKALYIPPGFAHGFLTLVEKTEVSYLLSGFYSAASSTGVRFNDPAFKIKWPNTPQIISEQDQNYPDFS